MSNNQDTASPAGGVRLTVGQVLIGTALAAGIGGFEFAQWRLRLIDPSV